MKLQDRTLAELKEILDGAPEGATHWNSNEKDDCWKYIKYDGADNYSLDDEGNWETSMEFHSHAKHGFLKLSDIRARINGLKPVFNVGDRVVIVNPKAVSSLFEVVYSLSSGVRVKEINIIDYGMQFFDPHQIRHATPDEIAAGHRIDELEAQSNINVTLWAGSIESKGVDGSEKPVFKVGDRVVWSKDDLKNLWRVMSDEDEGRVDLESKDKIWHVSAGAIDLRHATPAEIAAGHRIDTISAEMASPSAASDFAKNKAQMDLQENEPDIITVKLDPKKCRIVDPALPYDELPIDAELKAPIGQKHDQGKPRYSLIPSSALASIVGVLEYGARKYAPDNWKHVKNARERYYNASMRHVQSWWSGERLDPETGLPHLAHAVCSLMFLMALDGEQGE